MKIITFIFMVGLTIWLILMIANELATKRELKRFAEMIDKGLNETCELEVYEYDKKTGEPRLTKKYGKGSIPPKKK